MKLKKSLPSILLISFLNLSVFAQDVVIKTPDVEFNKEEYSDSYPGYRFRLFDYAGDLNGDDLPDFTNYYVYPNLETPDLTDIKQSRFFYFGSDNMSLTPDVETEAELNLGFLPIGDLNGDGFDDWYQNDGSFYFDLSGGQHANVISTKADFELTLQSQTFAAGNDLNSDGYEDIILFHRNLGYDRQFTFEIIYGAAEVDSIQSELYPVSVKLADDSDRFYEEATLKAKDLNGDDIPELLVYGYTDNSFNEGKGDFLILQLNGEIYEVAYRYNLNQANLRGAGDIHYGSFSINENPEIFLQTRDYKMFLVLEENDGSWSVSNEFELEEYQYIDLQPIGDFDGNGAEDFYISGNSEEGPAVLFGGSTIGEFEKKDIAHPDNRFLNRGPIVHDFNQDGYSDFIIGYTIASGNQLEKEEDVIATGIIVFEGNASRDVTNTKSVEMEIPGEENPLYTFPAGDFNDDGIEDYGIVYQNSANHCQQSRIEIFYGATAKDNWALPDLVIKHQEGYLPSYPATGDFNGDGISDLAVNYEDTAGGLNIYFGSSLADTEVGYQLTTQDLQPENDFNFEAFNVIENIGDVNGDGLDDLFLSTRSMNQFYSYILLGGEELSDLPDITINYKAINATDLGDIDQDGQSEFIVFDDQNNGSIYEYYNQENSEEFNPEPEYVLSAPVLTGSNINQFGISVTTGDFNGDDITDLAIKSAIHAEGTRVAYTGFMYEGGEAIFVYYGGEEFDEIPDHSFRIPLQHIRKSDFDDDLQTSFSFNEFSEITAIPDLNEDGTEELLFVSGQESAYLTNALIFMGSSDTASFGQHIGYVLEAPNQNHGLGNFNSVPETYTAHIAAGDFNADEKLDLILSQGGDWNYKSDPVMVYSFGEIVSSSEQNIERPERYILSQNYPNPFNPTTNISYSLPQSGEVKLQVFDVTGRLVSTLVNEQQLSGSYTQKFNASNLASGVYFYRLEMASFTQTRIMLLIK